MDRKHAKELLPLLQAFVDGKEIERKYGVSWINDDDRFHLDQEYRIKPEPIEIWCFVNSRGKCIANYRTKAECQLSIDDLNRDNNDMFKDYKAVMFRQVIDDL